MSEPGKKPATPADRRDRQVYVWWTAAPGPLALLGALLLGRIVMAMRDGIGAVLAAGLALACLMQSAGTADAGEPDSDAGLRRIRGVVRIPGLDATTPRPLPRHLYASQKALEEGLAGDPETRRRVAALLPLRLRGDGLCTAITDDTYVEELLRTARALRWKEAVPLLERALPGDGLGFAQRNRAGEAWFYLKTVDMSVKEQADFLVRIIRGEEPSVLPGMIGPVKAALRHAGARLNGGRAYQAQDSIDDQLHFLRTLHAAMQKGLGEIRTDDDEVRARVLGWILADTAAGPKFEEAMLADGKSFALYALFVQMAAIEKRTAREDELLLETVGKLWDYRGLPAGALRSIRYPLLLSDAASSQAAAGQMYAGFLKTILASEDPEDGGQLLWAVLSAIRRHQEGHRLPAGLLEQVRALSADRRYREWAPILTYETQEDQAVQQLHFAYKRYLCCHHRIEAILQREAERDAAK